MRNVLCVSACPVSLPKIIFLLQGQLKISVASQFWDELVLHDDATQHQQTGERMVTADVFRDLVLQSWSPCPIRFHPAPCVFTLFHSDSPWSLSPCS